MMEKIEKIQHIEGDAEPSSWENEGFAGFLPTLITCRRCDDAVREGRWFKGLTVDLGWRGRRWGRGPAGAQASPGSGGEGETDADAAKVAPCWCTTVMAVTCRSWIGCWRS